MMAMKLSTVTRKRRVNVARCPRMYDHRNSSPGAGVLPAFTETAGEWNVLSRATVPTSLTVRLQKRIGSPCTNSGVRYQLTVFADGLYHRSLRSTPEPNRSQ